jgi:hypothetical protein
VAPRKVEAVMKRFASTASGSLLLLVAGQACEAQVDAGYQGEPLVTLAGQVDTQQASPAGADVGVLWLAGAPVDSCSGPQRTELGYASGAAPSEVDAACTEACGSPFLDVPGAVEAWENCQRACGVEAHAGSIVSYSVCGSGAIGQTAPVFGDFPAHFSLDVLRPPPARALLRSDTGERAALGYFVALLPRASDLTLSLREGPPPWLLGGSETHVLMYAADTITSGSSWGLYLGGSFEPGYHLLRVQRGTRCGVERYYPYNQNEPAPPDRLPDADPTPAPTADDSTGDPDSEGQPADPDTVGYGDPGANPAGAITEVAPVPPDYSGIAHVCGNGVCEPEESCDTCSDCTGCVGGLEGTSSGITNQMPGAFCVSTPTRVVAAEGEEGDIQLLIARPELIDWPQL